MLSWAHIGLAGSFGALLIGGCGARAVSRKTPIYFIKWIQLPYELIRYLQISHLCAYFIIFLDTPNANYGLKNWTKNRVCKTAAPLAGKKTQLFSQITLEGFP